MLRIFAALAVASLTLSPAFAAPCHDAHGKFTKCPDKAPAKPKQCRKDGKFAKCGTPGAKPV